VNKLINCVCLMDSLSNSDVGNYITFAEWTYVSRTVSTFTFYYQVT
jgi:hypothetical protein